MPDEIMATFEDRFWQSADGLRLHARDYPGGTGLPIVCLHGLTRNARDFEALAPWLAARGHRVLAVDVRGRGLSARDPAARYGLPVYADDVRRMLETFAIPRALFVGTSMGGLITMALACRHPELVAGAVVNDVGPVLGEKGLTRIASYVGRPANVANWTGAAEYLRLQNAAALPHYGPADWAAMARRMFREDGGTVVPDYDPAIAHPAPMPPPAADPWGQWDALAAAGPVLLLRGALSDLLEAEVATAMASGRPAVTLVEVPDVGHAPMLDEPEAREAITAFLAGLEE